MLGSYYQKFVVVCSLLTLFTTEILAQNCPTANQRKNSSCLSVTFSSLAEATAAINDGESIVVTNSTGGSSDGIYQAQTNCGSNRVVFTKNGSSSCNCNGYNGTTAGEFEFINLGITCTYNLDGTLPVEILSFAAKKQGISVDLTWITTMEIDNMGFNIEHSIDGDNWRTIGFIKGHGTITKDITYQYLHLTPASGLAYYRLKQSDFNGNSAYSKIVSYHNQSATDDFIVKYTSSKTVEIVSDLKYKSVQIFNLNGSRAFSVQRSDTNILNLSHLIPGLYFLCIVGNDGKIITKKFYLY